MNREKGAIPPASEMLRKITAVSDGANIHHIGKRTFLPKALGHIFVLTDIIIGQGR